MYNQILVKKSAQFQEDTQIIDNIINLLHGRTTVTTESINDLNEEVYSDKARQ